MCVRGSEETRKSLPRVYFAYTQVCFYAAAYRTRVSRIPFLLVEIPADTAPQNVLKCSHGPKVGQVWHRTYNLKTIFSSVKSVPEFAIVSDHPLRKDFSRTLEHCKI